MDPLDSWFVRRPLWEKLLIIVCFGWSAVIFFLGAMDPFYGVGAAILVGPGLALVVYFAVRMLALLFVRRPPRNWG